MIQYKCYFLKRIHSGPSYLSSDIMHMNVSSFRKKCSIPALYCFSPGNFHSFVSSHVCFHFFYWYMHNMYTYMRIFFSGFSLSHQCTFSYLLKLHAMSFVLIFSLYILSIFFSHMKSFVDLSRTVTHVQQHIRFFIENFVFSFHVIWEWMIYSVSEISQLVKENILNTSLK